MGESEVVPRASLREAIELLTERRDRLSADLTEITDALRRYQRTLAALDPEVSVSGTVAVKPARARSDALPPVYGLILDVLGTYDRPVSGPELAEHPSLRRYASGTVGTSLSDLRKLGLVRWNGTGDRTGRDGRVYGKLNLWERVEPPE